MPDHAHLSAHAQDQARVFFALWPDARVRGELEQVAGQLHSLRGGRCMRPDTLHLTLRFVGNVPRALLPALKASATDLKLPAFELVLNQTHCWRQNRIACLTTSQPPPLLLKLVTSLEGRLNRLGIPFDRRPYVPHVTLVRHADCRPDAPEIQPIAWPVREFVLVESRLEAQGPRYQVLKRYALTLR